MGWFYKKRNFEQRKSAAILLDLAECWHVSKTKGAYE
jgi:hypothetical protein